MSFAVPKSCSEEVPCLSFCGKWSVHTVLAVQIGNAQDIELAAHGCGEGAADRALAGDKLSDGGRARTDGGGGGEAHESGDGGECELHCGWCGD